MFQIAVAPNTKCKLKLLRLERLKDFLAIEEEFLSNQESVKPREEKEQVRCAHGIRSIRFLILTLVCANAGGEEQAGGAARHPARGRQLGGNHRSDQFQPV